MSQTAFERDLDDRRSPADMSSAEFREIGHELVDQIADLFESLPDMPVTPGDDPDRVWERLGTGGLPDEGREASEVVRDAFSLLKQGSLFNGHPRFFGYITAGAAPIGVLGDFLAAAINPNCGGWPLSPTASAIEMQTVKWIAELVGFPTDCGGLLCSGGNVANMLGFWAARRWKTGADVRATGIEGRELVAYASTATHTWLEKASDFSGIGSDAVRMVETDADERMCMKALREAVSADLAAGKTPFMVVAASGTVSTGAIDPVREIRSVCDEFGLWLHVDGAYGAPAACLPEADDDLKAIGSADSVALDPHKWLYAPLEAGCVLVRDKQHLYDAFSHRPPYYRFDEHESGEWANFYEVGIQNSRGFRALKVWLALQQVGRSGYVESIRQDIRLTEAMAAAAESEPGIELRSRRLSIVTYRFVPDGIDSSESEYLNELNEEIVSRMQKGGEAFVSNAVLDGDYLMRACVVNFRTRLSDVQSTIALSSRLGREIDAEIRPAHLR